MPAGVGVGRYVGFLSAALFSMFLGAQTIHLDYRPLQDMDELVAQEKKKMVEKTEKP